MPAETVVHHLRGCPFALRLRVLLRLHRVPYRAVRFRDDEAGAARVREVNDGNELSPTVHVNGQWLSNPSWREVARAAAA
jgi:mycoredoxin